MKIFTSALHTFAFTFLFSICLSAQAAFINEINYLASNPTEAGIELAGESGQDLEGWSLAIYLADGTLDATEHLAGYVIPNQQNGYGTIWYDVEQSSGGGGVALVNSNGEVIQFLSYGAPTALIGFAGPAAGLVADYIGAQVVYDQALGLTGAGLAAVDFVWSLGSTSPGDVNLDQIFGMLAGLQAGVESTLATTTDITVSAYPNPVVNELNIRLSAPAAAPGNILLYDASGAILRQLPVQTEDIQFRFDVQHLPAGAYIVRYRAGATDLQQIILK